MSELLIELFSEEIPARMQVAAEEGFAKLVCDRLEAKGIVYQSCATYSTPRRLALHITGIPALREDRSEELKGPALTAPSQAVEGFLKRAGLKNVSECEQKDVKGTTYYFHTIRHKGGPTSEVLGELIIGALAAMTWPKSMRWGNSSVRWARPLHSVLALFDGKVVEGEFDLGGGQSIRFGNQTRGHRFMSDGQSFSVASFEDYAQKLESRSVILSRTVRKEKIWNSVQAAATKAGFTAKFDEKLLEEVTGLVEWPVPFLGEFDVEFLDIPPEVITTSMRDHQRYFAVLDQSGKLSNHFICVANVQPNDEGKTIIYGNRKVLRARLSDARFFWDQDKKHKLEDYLPRLEQIRFHEKLGSMTEKAMRLQSLAGFIASGINADKVKAERAALLAKADLVTGMVREFPELQGIMGGYYAAAAGGDQQVAEAIKSHYSPAGPNDSCPSDPVAVAVALADKVDTLVGFFSIGEKPTGSKDPFALRRSALGIIRLVLDNNLTIDLPSVLAEAASLYNTPLPSDIAEFMSDRFKVLMKGQGTPHNIIEAVASGENFLDMRNRMIQLSGFLDTDKGKDFVLTAKRAISILETEEKKGASSTTVKESGLTQPEEQDLYRALLAMTPQFNSFIKGADYQGAMTCLANVKDKVDLFFDKVVVNDNNPETRANRLAVLSKIRGFAQQIADFGRL